MTPSHDEPDREEPSCLLCGAPERVEIVEIWSDGNFQIDCCCEGLQEAIVSDMADDPYGHWTCCSAKESRRSPDTAYDALPMTAGAACCWITSSNCTRSPSVPPMISWCGITIIVRRRSCGVLAKPFGTGAFSLEW